METAEADQKLNEQNTIFNYVTVSKKVKYHLYFVISSGQKTNNF